MQSVKYATTTRKKVMVMCFMLRVYSVDENTFSSGRSQIRTVRRCEERIEFYVRIFATFVLDLLVISYTHL